MGSVIDWIKISTKIFSNRKIKFILSQKKGDKFFKIWIQLLTLAGTINDRGEIYLTKGVAYNATSLGVELGEPAKVISEALKIFESLEMIRVSEGVIEVIGWSEHQNIEGMERAKEQTRNRVRKFREKQKAVNEENVTITECNVTVTQQNKNKNKNIDIDSMEGIVNIDSGAEKSVTESCPTDQPTMPFIDVISFYQENIDPLMSSYIAECIKDDCEQYGKENVLAAMQQAKLTNKKRYDYIRGAAKGKHNDAIYGPSEAYLAKQKEGKPEEPYNILAVLAEKMKGEKPEDFSEDF